MWVNGGHKHTLLEYHDLKQKSEMLFLVLHKWTSNSDHVTQAQDFIFEHKSRWFIRFIIRNATRSLECFMFSIKFENNSK